MKLRHPTLRACAATLAAARPSATAAAVALFCLLPGPGAAAVHVWTGTVGANWSNAANWDGGLPIPGADTELVLDSAASRTTFNDIAGGFVLNRLTLGASVAAPVLTGQALSFQGADASLRMLSNAGAGQVNTALVLGSTLNVTGGPSLASPLYLQGAIRGSGGLNLTSGITVINNNGNSWTGPTRIEAGAVLVTAPVLNLTTSEAMAVDATALNFNTSLAVAAGGELALIGPGALNPTVVVSAPIQLGGQLSSSAYYILRFGSWLPGAFVTSTVTLTDAAQIKAFGTSALVLMKGVDRAVHTLTLETAGQDDLITLNNKPLAGQGDVLLKANGGGELLLGAVLGSGDIRVSGSGGKVELGAIGSDGGSGLLQVAFEGLGTVTMKDVISGQRAVRVSGGTLDLGALPHSFSGPIVVSDTGRLRVYTSASVGAAANTLRFERGGELEISDRIDGVFDRDIFTTGGMALVTVGPSIRYDLSSTITGDGGIAFRDLFGQSIVTLSGRNSFSGGLGVDRGVLLRFASDDNLGVAGGRIALSGSLIVPAGYALNRPLAVSGTRASFSASAAGLYTLAGNLSGSGRLGLAGSAPGTFFQLTGDNSSFSGGVLVSGDAGTNTAVLLLASDAQLGAATGVLDLGRAGALVPSPGTLRATADLNIAATRSTSFRNMTVDTNGFNVVFNQPINGLGINKTGAGTWTLNTANAVNPSTSGDSVVNVQQGTLLLGANEALGTRSLVSVAAGGQLALGGQQLSVISLDSAAGSSVDLGAGGTLRPLFGVLDGTLGGQGSLVIGRAGASAGGVILNGANSFRGAVEVTNGSRLTVGHAQALGAADNLIRLDQGTLATSSQMTAPLVISDATNLQIGAGGAGFLAYGQSLIIDRALTGPLALRIQRGSRPGEGAEKFDVRLANRANSFIGDLVLGDPQGLGTAVLGITADGSLGAAGNKLVLGKSLFDGETTRSAQGGLRAWDSLTLAASRSVLLDGAPDDTAGFIDTNGHTLVVAGSIGELASGLGLLKTGAGTLVMNGVQAYTGDTLVEEGALGGHGEVQRLTLQAATLAPGESAGLFSVREGLSFRNGALLALELGGLTRGSGYDAIDVGGSVDLGSDTLLQLSFIDGFTAQAGQQFQLINAGGGLFGQFANVANGERLLTADGAGSFIVRYGDGQGLLLSDFNMAPVPEPGTWALMALGLAGLAGWARRRAALNPSSTPAS